MKFILNKKIYDTEKAELLCSFKKVFESVTLLGTMYPFCDTCLYKTNKGNFFITYTMNYKEHMVVIDEEEAKEYLMVHNYDKYVDMYGPLEEA